MAIIKYQRRRRQENIGSSDTSDQGREVESADEMLDVKSIDLEWDEKLQAPEARCFGRL